MKIHISGLGVIPELQVFLKPLTVFVGENGTGKTWTAYSIAALFGEYGFKRYVNAYLQGRTAFRYPPVERTVKDLIEKGSATLNIVEFAKEHTETYINEIAKLAPNWLNEFMATRRVDFGNVTIRAELSEAAKQALSGKLKERRIELERFVGAKSESSELEFNCLKERGLDELYFYTTYAKNGSGAIPRPVVDKTLREFVVISIFYTIRSELFHDLVMLPTERTTVITIPFPHDEPEFGETPRTEEATEPRRSGPVWSLSKPVLNLRKMVEACTSQYAARKEEEARDPRLIEMMKLGRFLEQEILFGSISAERDGNLTELLYSPAEKVSLELNVSSSLVKELTPLALYLKCLAKPGDLIVIDEPEMNLHPAAQVEITEFLGMLVNAGLHVLITTHSPYIVDHIPNLIRAHDLDKEKVKEYFYLKQETSFLPRDKVAVYLFETDSVTDILKEDGDIDWGTFGDVSRDLSRISSRLIA
ncbi:MAG: AAA family ATPase [Thermodesulfobacteriota bacterium]